MIKSINITMARRNTMKMMEINIIKGMISRKKTSKITGTSRKITITRITGRDTWISKGPLALERTRTMMR
jgi:hypothetical protein